MWLPVVLLVLTAATVLTARSAAQVAPCDATCVGVPNPGANCAESESYVCHTCLLPRWCRGFGLPGTQICFDFAEEGLRITHIICLDGTHTDEWSAALCGSCYD
jgi:hypothetical protein